MPSFQLIEIVCMLGGFVVTLFTLLSGAMFFWSKISVRMDALEKTDSTQWKKLDEIDDWMGERERKLADMRLDIEKEIGIMREHNSRTSSRFEDIISRLQGIDNKIDKLESIKLRHTD